MGAGAETRESATSASGRSQKSGATPDPTKWAAALTQQLLARHGVLTREAVAAEASPAASAAVYPVLKAMEETAGSGAAISSPASAPRSSRMPGALDLLRSLRDAPDEAEVAVLAATDPANPYGATLEVARTSRGRGGAAKFGAAGA